MRGKFEPRSDEQLLSMTITVALRTIRLGLGDNVKNSRDGLGV